LPGDFAVDSYTVYTHKGTNPSYVCPGCETTKKEKLTPTQVRDKWTIEFMCTCGCSFSVSVEHRDFYRKLTNLEGSYQNPSKGGKYELMQVLNLSMSGIGFITQTFNTLSVDDRIRMNFILDDKKQSIVKKEGVVRHVYGNSVGCEFTDTENIDRNFAFYLMP
jgi:hypothetical protein